MEVENDSVVIHFIVGKKNLLSCSNFGSNSLTTGYLEFLFHATHFKIHEQFKIVNYIFQVILAKIKLNLIAVLL